MSYSGAIPSVNFGDVNLCGPENQPAPCSETLTLNYKVTATGTLGTPKVLTLGSPNLDFTLAEGSTCSGSVSAATTCSVKVQFVPRFAGDRIGAVQVTDNSGKAIATTPIYGSGIGPQIAATLGESQSIIPAFKQPGSYDSADPFDYPSIVVTNGAGDLFGVGSDLLELPVDGGPQLTLVSYPNETQVNSNNGLAIDGAGDLFFNVFELIISSDQELNLFSELPAGGSTPMPVPSNSSANGGGITVDGSGDIYFCSATQNFQLAKLPFACKTSSCVIPIASTTEEISSITADAAGDLFLLEYNTSAPYNNQIAKLPAGGGSPIVIITGPSSGIPNLYSLSVDGVGNLYTVASYGDETSAVIEYPAGSNSPITLYDLGATDPNNPVNYSVSVDTRGRIFLYTSFYNDGTTTDVEVFQRSQFAPLNFGSVAVGAAKTLPLEVDNIGNRPLVLRPSFTSPSYKVLGASPEGCLTSTAPAGSCTLSIEFRPVVTGPHTITFTLGSNGAADSVLLLEGVGTE